MTKRQLDSLEEMINTNPVAVARLLLQQAREQTAAGLHERLATRGGRLREPAADTNTPL